MSPLNLEKSRQRKGRKKIVEATLSFGNPRRIPRQLWVHLGKSELKKKAAWRKLRLQFPDDLIFCPPFGLAERMNKSRKKFESIVYRNEGSLIFNKKNGEDQKSSILPPIKKLEDLENWHEPEILLKLNKDQVNDFCRSTDRFVLAGTWVQLFERLQLLRGPEQLFSDLKKQPSEFFELLHRVHEFCLKELEMWAQTEVDGLCLMDDWGGKDSLFISPALFRHLFKPRYAEYASIAKKYNKYLFFHSDGYILDLLPDFIEIGINAINGQILLMGAKKLSIFRGQITFWGSSDFPPFLNAATKREIINCCEEIFASLWAKGGFMAQVELTPEIKISALETYFSAWKKFL